MYKTSSRFLQRFKEATGKTAATLKEPSKKGASKKAKLVKAKTERQIVYRTCEYCRQRIRQGHYANHVRSKCAKRMNARQRKVQAANLEENQFKEAQPQNKAMSLSSQNPRKRAGASSVGFIPAVTPRTNARPDVDVKKGRKRNKVVNRHSPAIPTDSKFDESTKPWWEVSGGLYGLGKNRKH